LVLLFYFSSRKKRANEWSRGLRVARAGPVALIRLPLRFEAFSSDQLSTFSARELPLAVPEFGVQERILVARVVIALALAVPPTGATGECVTVFQVGASHQKVGGPSQREG